MIFLCSGWSHLFAHQFSIFRKAKSNVVNYLSLLPFDTHYLLAIPRSRYSDCYSGIAQKKVCPSCFWHLIAAICLLLFPTLLVLVRWIPWQPPLLSAVPCREHLSSSFSVLPHGSKCPLPFQGAKSSGGSFTVIYNLVKYSNFYHLHFVCCNLLVWSSFQEPSQECNSTSSKCPGQNGEPWIIADKTTMPINSPESGLML